MPEWLLMAVLGGVAVLIGFRIGIEFRLRRCPHCQKLADRIILMVNSDSLENARLTSLVIEARDLFNNRRFGQDLDKFMERSAYLEVRDA